MVGWCEVLSAGILCSCSYPPRPGYSVPVTFNKTMLLSVLNLFCFYMNGLLKVRALRMGFLYISGYRQ